jgi:hypothetical protein
VTNLVALEVKMASILMIIDDNTFPLVHHCADIGNTAISPGHIQISEETRTFGHINCD